jgi:hypothetical protein
MYTVLYDWKAWGVTLKTKYRLQITEKSVLRKSSRSFCRKLSVNYVPYADTHYCTLLCLYSKVSFQQAQIFQLPSISFSEITFRIVWTTKYKVHYTAR